MDKMEYLATTYRWLQELVDAPRLQRDLSQVRARATQEELLIERPEVRFTFDAERIWKYCDYIFSESGLLLREGSEDRRSLIRWTGIPAQAFEFLARFAAEGEAEFLLLNSAICYHIAGYQANAQCLANLLRSKYALGALVGPDRETPNGILAGLFRRALISFLRRDLPELQQTTAQALSSIRALQEDLVRNIAAETVSYTEFYNLIAHAYFHQTLSHFVQHCLSGKSEHFWAACGSLQKCHIYFQKGRETAFGTVASELRTALELFNERSTWSSITEYAGDLLDERVWRVYLRNLAYEKSITEFWSSQLRALGSGILTSEDSFVVQMPTSAGKTLIAELCILAAMTTQDQARCLYVAPYRALVNEIQRDLSGTLGAVGYRVSSLIGGFEFDAFEGFVLSESDVLVATPEKIELFLRAHPEEFEHLAVVVVDEGHILDEGIPSSEELDGKNLVEELNRQRTLGRGPLLELLITRLKRRLPGIRFVFLSAVMPEVNAADFTQWLAENRLEPLRIDPDERPSRQAIARFDWLSAGNGQLEYISLPKLPDGRAPFVPYFLRRQQYFTGERTSTGRLQKRSWPDTGNKAQTTAMLAAQFARTGPVLVFCAQQADVGRVVEHLITSLEYLEASGQLPNEEMRYVDNPVSESFQLAQEWFGEEHRLTRALHRGVGLHFGALPDPVRLAIEDDFKSDKLQVLVSTSTLGQGVNLPIKTAIIYSLERRWGEGEENVEQVKRRDFWNICGRAGRAGQETEGHVVFVIASEHDEQLLEEYRDQANLEQVDSALYKLLQALVERRINQDELIQSGCLDSHILAILAEEVVDTQDEAAIREFLGDSLVGVQALRNGIDLAPLVSAIRDASRWVVGLVPDAGLRRVFASTGLRVASCAALERAADLFAESVTKELLETEQNAVNLNEDLLEAAFSACRGLPEMVRKEGISYYGPDDEFVLVKAWVTGRPVRELRTGFWDPARSESFSEYLSDRILSKLPWGFNAFLRIVAFKLETRFEDLPVAWKYLSSMMKFGVNNVVACWASSLAVPSRSLALQLSWHYQPQDRVSFPEFIRWLVNLPTEFVLFDLEGSEFEKQRLLRSISDVVPSGEYLEFIRSDGVELVSPVRGIRYEDRWVAAAQVKEGDELSLEVELDNVYDPYAVRVLFNNQHIGYVEREKARIVSREIQLGREVYAYATLVKPPMADYPSPWIEMTIKLR